MEHWKPIPGYEGIYEASDLGRIRSAPGKTTANKRYRKRVWKTRILSAKHPVDAKRKDARVSLWKDGTQRDWLVSRLVALAWIGVPDNQLTVNHINWDWEDNRPENLEWVTLSDNIKKGFETGLFSSFCKCVTLIEHSGEEHRFQSFAEADRFLNRKTGYMSGVIKKGRTARGRDGTTYTVAPGAF